MNWLVLDARPYEGDGRQYALMAYNLKMHNTLALEEDGAVSPSNAREPAYPFLLSVTMRLVGIDAAVDPKCLVGERAGCDRLRLYLKGMDVTIQLAIALVAAIVAWQVTASAAAAALAAALLGSSTSLLAAANTGTSEVLAALLVLLHSWGLFQIFRGAGRASRWALLSGIALGLLILTKAAFVAWLMVLIPAILVAAFFSPVLRELMRPLIVVGLVAALLPSGWVVRNWIQLGNPVLAERGPQVIALRAQYGDITFREYVAGYAYFTPLVGQRVLDRFFEPADWQRFDRTSPTGFKATAAGPDSLAGQHDPGNLGRGAVLAILARLPTQVAMVPLLTYQAAFLQVGYNTLRRADSVLSQVLVGVTMVSHVLFVPAVLCLGLLAFIRRQWPLVALLVPSLFAMGLHAAITHYIPRYNGPMVAIMALAVVICCHELAVRLRSRRRQG